MSSIPEFTESYEVHVKSRTFDKCLNITSSSSDLLQNGEKSSFLRYSAVSELKKIGIETNVNDITEFSFKRIKP